MFLYKCTGDHQNKNVVTPPYPIRRSSVRLDAIPGRLNETSFTIEKPGVYFGQCSELCGARHAFMPIAVEAVPAAEFAAWVRAKGGTMPGDAAAAPAQDRKSTRLNSSH